MKELRIGNKSLIKDINIYLVLSEIRKNNPISRAEISKNTGLAQSTITNIVNSLIKEGLINVVGDGKSTGGRKPIQLELNYNYGHSIAVKIETNHFIVSVCDLVPSVVSKVTVPYPKNSTFDEFKELFIDSLLGVKKEAIINKQKILGIGVTLSGMVDQNKDYQINSTLLGWYDAELKQSLEELFNVKVVIENDVNCFTQYHNDTGIGKDINNFVCVTVGEGIGSGIIINGELYRGYFGGAGEFGHQILHPGGKQCYCGQKGCLEMYSAEDVLIDEINKLVDGTYSYNDIFKQNLVTKDVVLKASEVTLTELSYGLINLIMQLNPQQLIIGVKPEYYAFQIKPLIDEYVSENWFSRKGHMHTAVELSELTEDKFILGVASMVVEEILKNPVFTGFKSIV